MLKHAQVKKQQHFLRECGCRESHSKNKKKISPMEDRETILKDVFGDSSSEEGSEHDKFDDPDRRATSGLAHGEIPSWERISQMDGLWLCKDFLSSDRQESLLSAINREGWFGEATGNQAMRFGDLPEWAIELSNCIREFVFYSDSDHLFESVNKESPEKVEEEVCHFPSDLLWRDPLFDQLIVNIYQPGEGICAHVDLMRFEDGIAIISLESSCVMHFTPVGNSCSAHIIGEEAELSALGLPKIPLLLTPGSLVLMWGEARYLWKHEINRKPGFQKWDGLEMDQQRRTSITLRKLCQSC